MKTSLKTGAAQIFSCSPQNTGELENFSGGGGGWLQPLHRPLACTPPLTKLKRISSSSSNEVVLTF